MEYKCSECYRCKHFLRYYTKGVKQHNKTAFGWCCQKTDSVEIHGTCENFALNPRRKKSRKLLGYYLGNLLTEISSIRMILEEEDSEERNV